MDSKNKLINSLQKIDVIQRGDFTLKSGAKSEYYFDLRKIYSYPDILVEIARQLRFVIGPDEENFDLVCGVPLAGIPLATTYSLLTRLPMIVLRKERKDHGMKNLIEGNYKTGDRVLLIEDVITTGSSINETYKVLMEAGLKITTAIVVIDRRLNPKETTVYTDVKALLNMTDIMNFSKPLPQSMVSRQFHNNYSSKLWDIMINKKTNLCYSMDVYDLAFIEKIADYICLLKVHLDVITDRLVDYTALFSLAERKKFFIMDDRKYADIGHIVKQQYSFNHLSDIKSCTVHSIFGESTLDGLRAHYGQSFDGCFLIAQSSAPGSLISTEYTTKTYQLGYKNKQLVSGFITQQRLGDDSFLYLTPGVNLSSSSDNMGQGYRSVEQAISQDRCDIIIVGRGIYNRDDSMVAVREYRDLGWKYLLQRYSSTSTN